MACVDCVVGNHLSNGINGAETINQIVKTKQLQV